ncbi:TPA: hypothetical protein QCO65_002048 [Bacillus cereus]|uniref:hypothetical protein n=2 Tax=Bacillaceae TaxID=186817 RepID=UPI001C020463|nr:hypothetical protein [Bacillus mycoides]QWG30790.1 hypothetical protein EXW58_25835 [Bacillus mycoides]HDR3887653.1 hypothetical protein [Bacillus cereus]HDR7608988.1 hypothetical protein [Bacillus mycoides]
MKKLLVLPAIALSLIGTGTAAASTSVPETNVNMNKTPEVTEINPGNGNDSIIMYSSILLGSQTVSFNNGSGTGYFWNKSGDDLKFWIQNTGPSTLHYKLINSAGHTLYRESISPGAQKTLYFSNSWSDWVSSGKYTISAYNDNGGVGSFKFAARAFPEGF